MTTSTKCRAKNPAECTDPNCPEKRAQRAAFFGAPAKQSSQVKIAAKPNPSFPAQQDLPKYEVQVWEASGETHTFSPQELAGVENQLEVEIRGASRDPEGRYALEAYEVQSSYDAADDYDIITARFYDIESGQRYSGIFERDHELDIVQFAGHHPVKSLKSATKQHVSWLLAPSL